MRPDFHEKPFDEGTLAKLELFQLYARAWLPVFLSGAEPVWPEVHIFDFFAGPGQDVAGTAGSPLRIVQEAIDCRHKLIEGKVHLHFHFSDADEAKTRALESCLRPLIEKLPHATLDVQAIPFEESFQRALPILHRSDTANLVLIDPCGVNHVDDEVFRQLISAPTTDFLLFVASSFLHRFSEHPAMRLRIKKSDSFYHCHRAVVELYRTFIPANDHYYLAPFSIKKEGSQLYGLIFGTSHLLGMDKFLNTAWTKDTLNGEANFDINQEDFQEHAPFLPLDMFDKPTKLRAFAADLREQILTGKCVNELEVVEVCFQHGVKRQHAEAVLRHLKTEGRIKIHFRVPQIDHKPPRLIELW